MPEELRARVAAAAAESDRSLNGQIVHLLELALEEREPAEPERLRVWALRGRSRGGVRRTSERIVDIGPLTSARSV